MADPTASRKSGSTWRAETNPAYARAWLASLAPVDNVDSARELYQGLRALNRAPLEAAPRFELLELYRDPIRQITGTLQDIVGRTSFPMPAKLRRFVEFVCQLHGEMALGYKTCVQDLPKEWHMPWRRRQLQVAASEQALSYLGQVLLRSYQFYLPVPPGVWRDAHALYRLVEHYDRHERQVEVGTAADKGGATSVSVSQRYRRLLLLGIANPYQMPVNECLTVYRFLEHRVDEVAIESNIARMDHTACFLIDPRLDTPPAPLDRAPSTSEASLRLIDTTELVRTLRIFVHRLERGERVEEMNLGIDALDDACHDMLQRLLRMYSQTVSRRHSRIKRHESVFICVGLGATHFFAGNQRPMETAPEASEDAAPPTSEMVMEAGGDESYVELDEAPVEPVIDPAAGSVRGESYRVDRWQVRDLSPQGILLAHDGKPGVRFRVGDVLGIQRANIPGQWSVGLVRWVKARSEAGVEAGVELVAPEATPGSLRAAVADEEVSVPALLLPAIEVARRPASVVVPRGAIAVGADGFLTGPDQQTRRVRVMEAINRTGSIEQLVTGAIL